MTRRSRPPLRRPAPAWARAAPDDYLARTRSPAVNVVFLMPWLLLYWLCLLASRSPLDNAAAAWLKAPFEGLPPLHGLALSLAATLALVGILLARLDQARRDRGLFGGMLIEGLVYGALLGIVGSLLASRLPMGRMVLLQAEPAAWLEGLRGSTRELGLALGAGIFEELVFRALLVGGGYLGLRRGLGLDPLTAGAVSILGAAWLFSAYHHAGPGGEPYDPYAFAFRFHAGAALGVIFLTRGLGIAAFAHGFYDALVLLAP